MVKNCLICERIRLIQAGKNPYFVVELETGYVVLCDYQLFKGYTLFLAKQHKRELRELNVKRRMEFLCEMSLVAEAVFRAFKPAKLNYELLGNSEPHLHWHIIPRYRNDLRTRLPIWSIDPTIRNSDANKSTKKELANLKMKLLKSIRKLV
ncbi:HIT family protein [Candidatus Kaiserbacteria bacterium]|nr:HIT family protein [Candidatus Kaiserbacteria bacterium]